jgi:hypothetical protein
MHSLQVAMWEQCGGVNGPTRGLMCVADAQCAYANQWLWQCQPKGTRAPGPNHGGMCKPVSQQWASAAIQLKCCGPGWHTSYTRGSMSPQHAVTTCGLAVQYSSYDSDDGGRKMVRYTDKAGCASSRLDACKQRTLLPLIQSYPICTCACLSG